MFSDAAEEAATFYVSLLPDSRIDRIVRSPSEAPNTKKGDVLVVEFTLAGRSYAALRAPQATPFTEAMSLQAVCDDQAEVDRLWSAFLDNGGKALACGWLKDKWGVPWQIVPRQLGKLMSDPDAGRAQRAMQAMMKQTKIDIAAIEQAADAV